MEDVSNRTLSMIRTFNAPVDLLWKVLTNAEHIAKWWGPEGFTNTIHKMDVRKGGKWEFTMHGPDGTDYENNHTYLEIIVNQQIILDHKNPNFEIIVNLTDKGDQTEVEWIVEFDSVPTMEEAIRAFKADIGMEQNLNRFQEYVNQMK